MMRLFYACILGVALATMGMAGQEMGPVQSGGIQQRPDMPLEQQIRDLEEELARVNASVSPKAEPFEVTPNLKQRLNELYALRPENQRANPLDQGGDDCASVTVIPALPYEDLGTTVGLTNNWNTVAVCASSSNAPDAIYTFTAVNNGIHTVSLCGSSYDTAVEVRAGGACPGSVQVACNDEFCNNQSQVSFGASAGQQFWIIVDGYANLAGEYWLTVTGPCSVPCQAGDVIECAETPGPFHANSDCNGGCNNISYGGGATFQPISCGQTACGVGFTYLRDGNLLRDTDWYVFTLSEACTVQVTAVANFPVQIGVLGTTCPQSALMFYGFGLQCGQAIARSQSCLPAGVYAMFVAPQLYNVVSTPQPYRATLQCLPCSGCDGDETLNAPGSVSGTTCGAIDNCNLRPAEDRVVRVVIPHYSRWTFSLCGMENIWDSYLALSYSCCGNYIAIADEGCGPSGSSYGLSKIECLELGAGYYYVNIEGTNSSDCGPYTLSVTECLGRCCYGSDPLHPTNCAVTNSITCNNDLFGRFYPGETCASGCLVRPDCFANTLYGQQPHLPSENANGYGADVALPLLMADNFSGLTEPVSAVRFWGWNAEAAGPCPGFPLEFTVSFHADSSGFPGAMVCSHTEVLFPTTQTYFYTPSDYDGQEYQMVLPSPCTLGTGWVMVRATAPAPNPNCHFYWLSSPQGNGTLARKIGNNPWQLYNDNLSFCLGAPCAYVDSFVIRHVNPTLNRLYFKATVSGTHKLYRYADLLGQAYLTPGWWMTEVAIGTWNRSEFMIQVNCEADNAPPARANEPGEETIRFVPVSGPKETMR